MRSIEFTTREIPDDSILLTQIALVQYIDPESGETKVSALFRDAGNATQVLGMLERAKYQYLMHGDET